LIQLVIDFDQRGFTSEDFRSRAAGVLEKAAERNQGLSQSVLTLLKSWLSDHSMPELFYHHSKDKQHSNLELSILFGVKRTHFLPDGRSSIVRAIAQGYLRQNPPDLTNWTRFINSQLGVESRPAIWVDIVSRMPPLLNGGRTQATELFDQVIRNCPEILQYSQALHVISHTIGWFEPQETVAGWLDILLADDANFSRQAYGELLLIQYFQYQDEWSVGRIDGHLASPHDEAILCGLAHAASHLWVQQRCRAIAAEILSTLAASTSPSIQHAVASVFRWSRDSFKLDKGMLKIIEAICQNQGVLLESANNLTEIIEAENLVEHYPEVTAKVCKSLVDIISEPTNPLRTTALIADSLITIAIQLHRQPSSRELGLQMFEQLLALNLREAQSALETLDRKPNRSEGYVFPRKILRRRFHYDKDA